MVEENHNLIYTFLQKYHLPIEDYYDLAAIGLCKAGSKFDSNKSKFSTYAYKCMSTTVFLEMRNRKLKKRIPENQIIYYQDELDNSNGGDTSTFINFIPSKENIEANVLSDIIFEEYMSKLKDKDKRIIMLLKDGYKQREIVEIVGCSQGKVSRVRTKLYEFLES